VYFGRQNGPNDRIIELLRDVQNHSDPQSRHLVQLLRGIRHLADNTSHDVITYDDYLQPPLGNLLLYFLPRNAL